MRQRPPTDVPNVDRRAPRGRVGLVVIGAVAFVVLTSLRGIAGFYTDYLWFDELDLTSVWRGILTAKVGLSVLFTLAFFVLMWANLAIADRIAPRFRPFGPEDEIVARYQELVGPYAGKVRVGMAALFALIAGTGASAQWGNWILFRNAVDFEVADPQFGLDLGFYVFRLPFLTRVVDWAFVALILVLVMTLVAHYLNGGIRLQSPVQRVTPQVKAHLSVLLGLLAVTKAAGYWLARYELLFSTRGPVDGGTYTDVNAQLPALNLLVVISVAAAVLFLVNIRLRGWVLPVIAVALWGLVSVAIGGIYPAFIQRFRVEPNELAREREFIARNIGATRAALNLAGVKEHRFEAADDLTSADLAENSETIRNVRLWDPPFLEQTYQRLQELRSYFRFNDVDIDRYGVDGRVTQVVLSARELKPEGLPSQSWVNRHLQYTHGYGAVLSPANAVTPEGQPDFLVSEIPPRGEPPITRPELYYGEELGGYAIANSQQAEIDFTTPEGTDQTSRYRGKGGVRLDSPVKRAALALRFGDLNIVTSSAITEQSRAIYFRDIRERVRTAAPFLKYDADPYPVVVGGRILWIVDAYTTTNRYPYAQRTSTDRLPAGSGLRGVPFNYVRNSVKVVVDAYDGTLTFYVVDEKDPIARAYRRAFPALFSTTPVPDQIRDHLRYPEDLFRVQSTAYGRYHIQDPSDFYGAADAWDVAQDPGSGRATTGGTTATTDLRGRPGPAQVRRMDPYYLLMRLPDEEEEDFLILQPFVPTSRDDTRKELSAFMIAKSDREDYGELETFVMPRDRQVDGPSLVDARIHQEPTISRELTLLDQSGSQVLQGNLLVIPIKNSLLYIRPLYVQAEATQVPEFKRAIVVYSNRVVMRDSLQQALAAIFGEAPQTLEQQPAAPGTPPGGPPPGPPVAPDVRSFLDQAADAFAEADAALRQGDLATFQRRYRDGVELVNRARGGAPAGTTTTTTTTTQRTTSA
jgi:uncharacterized membrane protein (UPF0182 family)